MKISFISQYFHPEQFSNNSIALDLVRRGHSVKATVCVPNYPTGVFFPGYSNKFKRRETWKGIEIKRVWTISRGNRAISLIGNYLSYVVAGSFSVLKSADKPDVIFASEPSPVTLIIPGIVQRWRTGAPLVCWVQDIWPESAIFTLGIENKTLQRILFAMSGWIYRRADLILIQSPAFRPMLQRFGIPDEKIKVFPNTAPEGFEPKAPNPLLDQDLLGPNGKFRVMFAGNIGESQDFKTIVATAKLLEGYSNLQWVIIGDGRYLERLQDLVKTNGLSHCFSFVGRRPESQMPLYFAHSDALLVALKDTEIFAMTIPYKVQCYMACGRPLLASLAGEGARTIEVAQAGLSAKPGSPHELAEKLSILMSMPEEARAKMGENGRNFFLAHYAQDLLFDRLDKWLHEIAAAKVKR